MESNPISREQSRPSAEQAGNERLNRALDLLEQGVENYCREESFQQYLEFLSRFHDYSWANSMLIIAQRPDATMVAGYRKWQQMGRQVMRGERGISIITPRFRKEPDELTGETIQKLVGFGTGNVFDISQTEGEDIPRPEGPKRLDGDSPEAELLTSRTLAYLQDERVLVQFKEIEGTALGKYHPIFKTIHVREDMPADQTAKTLIHEAAHYVVLESDWGKQIKTRGDHEQVAEASSFVVCHHYGLDTSEYSFAYVSHWSGGELDRVKENFGAIQRTSKTLIEAMGELGGGEQV